MFRSPYRHRLSFTTSGGTIVPINSIGGVFVDYMSTANLSDLTSVSTAFDGATLVVGKLVWLKDQTTATQNGCYFVDTVTSTNCLLLRAPNFETGVILPPGFTVNVGNGVANGGLSVQLTGTAAKTIGTDSLVFASDSSTAAGAFKARNVAAAGNVASLAAFTVASNDGVTNVAGDVIILAEQSTAAQNGPYVVGTVASGSAPLSRPGWWDTGDTLSSAVTIAVGGEGTVFKNTTWRPMVAAATFVIGTTDPKLYPVEVSGTTVLIAGTFTISTVPIFSAKTSIQFSRSIANTSTLTVGGYHATVAGADGITPGVRGTAAAVVQATVGAGTISVSDVSTLHWTIRNQAA